MPFKKYRTDEDEELIEYVRSFTQLYDPSDEDNRNIVKKANIWNEIAHATGRSVADCKRRWRDIRDTYFRIFRKAQFASGPTTWPLFERLAFLDCVKHKNKSSTWTTTQQDCGIALHEASSSTCEKIVIDEDNFVDIQSIDIEPFVEQKLKVTNKRKAPVENLQEVEIDSDNSVEIQTIDLEPFLEQKSEAKKKRNAQMETVEERANRIIAFSEQISAQKEEEDEIDLFMRSMALKMKKLPYDVVHNAQMDIMRILSRYSKSQKVHRNIDHSYVE